jgi:hypothetical protein
VSGVAAVKENNKMEPTQSSAGMPPPPPLIDCTELLIHRVYRERIVQEDNLINHRMMWMVLSQAFMFALWGLLFQRFHQAELLKFGVIRGYLYVIAGVGMLFAWGSKFSISAAQREIKLLRSNYLAFYPDPTASKWHWWRRASSPPDLTKIIHRESIRRDILPGLTSKHFHFLGHLTPTFMPIGLIALWIVLIYVVWRKAKIII